MGYKRLLMDVNNKGMSAVEVVICFTLVSIISISLLNVVMSYKDREDLESYKQEIITYKNNVTKVIQDDITNYILKSVQLVRKEYGPLCGGTVSNVYGGYDDSDDYTKKTTKPNNTLNKITYELSFVLSNEVKTLVVDRGNNTITYTEDGKNVVYTVPDLGTSSKEKIGKFKCFDVKALRISDFDMRERNNFFIVDVNFYHNRAKLGNKYGVHIKAPIGFTTA